MMRPGWLGLSVPSCRVGLFFGLFFFFAVFAWRFGLDWCIGKECRPAVSLSAGFVVVVWRGLVLAGGRWAFVQAWCIGYRMFVNWLSLCWLWCSGAGGLL